MIQVWGRRNASNVLPVMWAIGELDLPHLRHDVGGSFGGLDTPKYRAMNPGGRIPTIDDDGFVLRESNAIVRYLCRRYGQRTLAPDTEHEWSVADQWMEWHKTTFYPPYIDLFWAVVRTEPALRDSGQIKKLAEATARSLPILDAGLARHPYVAGERLTMADIPIGTAIHRYLQLEVERPETPNVEAWYRRLCARPAYRKHVMFPYGRNPGEWYRHEQQAGGA